MTNIMRKTTKILLILFIIQIMFAIVTVSEASGWLNKADDFLNAGRNTASTGKITSSQSTGDSVTIKLPTDLELRSIISDIFNVIFPIGVAITVIMGGVLGINFMVSSAEDKAKVKESLVPYVVGCVAIYGVFGIWKLAISIFSLIG